ncbi:MAG: endonuclease domain-containing protein [Alphaproteobacteria bacterium]|nr:endonuclease domain-containing protein [Alphaproteobacteria bacterium]
MTQVSSFFFQSYDFEPQSGVLRLCYAFEGGESFEERIIFPPPLRALDEAAVQALDRAVRLIFLLAGVSYYKARIPSKLVCHAFDLDPRTDSFCRKVYENGLSEFAYRNKVRVQPNFETNGQTPKSIALTLPARVLVPIGGGKDSIVTLEALRKGSVPLTLLAVSGGCDLPEPIDATIKMSGLPFLHIKRHLSPELLRLNQEGAFNGHVPITAILSAVSVACALLYGFDSIAFSNERSADAPNLVVDGRAVNHQYSKSWDFEKDFGAYVQETISPSVHYFSFLRPLSEAAIAQRFAEKAGAYYKIFRSCNAAFRQNKDQRAPSWCGDCPKCRFVFLALAPFMTQSELVDIFGANLLDDKNQIEGFKALCGIEGIKPFECVGETQESAVLLLTLYHGGEWQNSCVVQMLGPLLAKEVDEKTYNDLFRGLFEASSVHNIPAAFQDLL